MNKVQNIWKALLLSVHFVSDFNENSNKKIKFKPYVTHDIGQWEAESKHNVHHHIL